VDVSTFYGYPGAGGSASDGNFQWDGASNPVVTQPSIYDQYNMFVSPSSVLSGSGITYCNAMDNAPPGGCTDPSVTPNDANIVIDGLDAGLLYPVPPAVTTHGTYDTWSGAEQENAGNAKGTGATQYEAQQQLNPNTPSPSYCEATYGKGWRLPTDIEMGHQDDAPHAAGTGQHDIGYEDATGTYFWTSSAATYGGAGLSQYRWVGSPANATDEWADVVTNTYDISLTLYVRCVFKP